MTLVFVLHSPPTGHWERKSAQLLNAVEPGQNVELTVKSNHPSFPLIKVPVFVPQFPRNPADGPVKVPTAAKN